MPRHLTLPVKKKLSAPCKIVSKTQIPAAPLFSHAWIWGDNKQDASAKARGTIRANIAMSPFNHLIGPLTKVSGRKKTEINYQI